MTYFNLDGLICFFTHYYCFDFTGGSLHPGFLCIRCNAVFNRSKLTNLALTYNYIILNTTFGSRTDPWRRSGLWTPSIVRGSVQTPTSLSISASDCSRIQVSQVVQSSLQFPAMKMFKYTFSKFCAIRCRNERLVPEILRSCETRPKCVRGIRILGTSLPNLGLTQKFWF